MAKQKTQPSGLVDDKIILAVRVSHEFRSRLKIAAAIHRLTLQQLVTMACEMMLDQLQIGSGSEQPPVAHEVVPPPGATAPPSPEPEPEAEPETKGGTIVVAEEDDPFLDDDDEED